jgi:arsenate reductase
MTPSAHPWQVLFLCTGNSARSIIAESLLCHWGREQFIAHSAGSHPAGEVRPLALEVLERAGLPTAHLYSKSLDAFTGADAPTIDLLITVCDDAAEACPIFPGEPITAHWGLPDPAAVDGDEAERRQAFVNTRSDLERRIKLLVNLPFASLDRLASERRIRTLGQQDSGPAETSPADPAAP